MPERAKTLLVCPLNWGLGHASRCVPVIRHLLQLQQNVVIAASGNAFHFLKSEFPSEKHIYFADYGIRHPKSKRLSLMIALQLPLIFYRIFREHNKLKKIIRDHHIDVVISDNRFGLRNSKTYCVYITHQIHIQAPARWKFLEPWLFKLHKHYIKKFNACWIPDQADGFRLAGALSDNTAISGSSYTGLLSRFSGLKSSGKTKYKLCIIISGPEPQRSSFESIVLDQLDESAEAVVFLGRPDKNETITRGNNIIMSHASAIEMHRILSASEIIISRSGYSTVMDIATLGKKAVLVPTPGQTEQEYLACYLMKNNICYSEKQDEFNLNRALEKSGFYKGFDGIADKPQIEEMLKNMLKKIT